jgi:hypothetical protein
MKFTKFEEMDFSSAGGFAEYKSTSTELHTPTHSEIDKFKPQGNLSFAEGIIASDTLSTTPKINNKNFVSILGHTSSEPHIKPKYPETNRIKAIPDRCEKISLESKDDNTYRYFNIQQAAEYLGFSVNTVYQKTCRRAIPFMGGNKKRLEFDPMELDLWRQINRTAEAAQAIMADREGRACKKVGMKMRRVEL